MATKKEQREKLAKLAQEVKSRYDKVSNTPGIFVKGGPRPTRLKVKDQSQSEARKAAMERTAQRMKSEKTKNKPTASAGKSNPKAAVKGKGSLPKSATMKSRGSKTATQMGDMNQREGYNAMRGSNAPIGKSKQSKASAKTSTQKAVRTYQRAGGKGK